MLVWLDETTTKNHALTMTSNSSSNDTKELQLHALKKVTLPPAWLCDWTKLYVGNILTQVPTRKHPQSLWDCIGFQSLVFDSLQGFQEVSIFLSVHKCLGRLLDASSKRHCMISLYHEDHQDQWYQLWCLLHRRCWSGPGFRTIS